MKYNIVEAQGAAQMERLLEGYFAGGWKLHGDLKVLQLAETDHFEGGDMLYVQAMIIE